MAQQPQERILQKWHENQSNSDLSSMRAISEPLFDILNIRGTRVADPMSLLLLTVELHCDAMSRNAASSSEEDQRSDILKQEIYLQRFSLSTTLPFAPGFKKLGRLPLLKHQQ